MCWWGLVPRLWPPVQNGDGGSDEHPDAAGGGRLPGAAGERCTGPGSCEMKGGSRACPVQRLLGGAGSAIASTPNPSKRSFPTRGGPLLPSPKAMHHASGCEGGLVRCPMAKGHPAPPSIMMMLRGWPLAGSAQFGAHPKHTHMHTLGCLPLIFAPFSTHPHLPTRLSLPDGPSIQEPHDLSCLHNEQLACSPTPAPNWRQPHNFLKRKETVLRMLPPCFLAG